MDRLPTGTVTFLFTDIEGSTARWDHHPDAMRAALERHDALLHAAVAAHGGHVFKTVGDAFCAAFQSARSGVAAAVEAQRAVAREDWSAFGAGFSPIAVRMGLHTGEATERGGDYFGPPVNRAARIEAAGHGGQILLSSATRDALEGAAPLEGIALRDRGEHRLKDLRHAEHIVQVVVAGLPDVVKALRTAGQLSLQDRIVVAEPGAPVSAEGLPAATVVVRTVDETLGELEAVVRGDARSIVLTAEQLVAAARHVPPDWRAWRLGRVAEWSQPRYRLDGRFVALSLLVDQGEASPRGRWAAAEARYSDLGALLAGVDDPALVVLGPPGSGKSTLLRRLELEAAIAGLRGDAVHGASDAPGAERVTFFVPLNTYATPHPGEPPPSPRGWLAERWAARYPMQPPLEDLLAQGRVTLLLDALNEMPAPTERDARSRVQLWKAWLQQLVAAQPGNRVVFSCRSLDYSQPLSTPELRVPQVQVEALSDDQVRDFLALYTPGRWREIWATLHGSAHLDVLRSPYFLSLLVEQVEATGELPAGRAALFTGFVRQALRREVERGGASFEAGELLESRDLRTVTAWTWRSPYDLPERGPLIPKLSHLAHAMQSARDDGGGSQVRIDYDAALELLDGPEAEAIVAAGEALAVLDEDQAADELMYVHQLVQEYFAARRLAQHPDPALVRVPWKADALSPALEAIVDALDPADALPPMPQTGWEETTVLAAAMAADPSAFVRGVMTANLALAGRAAAQAEVRERLDPPLVDALRWALVERTGDASADLRDRIACGMALGELHDPRFGRHAGPDGSWMLPPMVAVPPGEYPIGDDEPIDWVHVGIRGTSQNHVPRHAVRLEGFAIGALPVTNAEWACFMAAGGYDDARWWDTEAAQAWRRGEMANEGLKANNRRWRRRFLSDPALFPQMEAEGSFPTTEVLERWRGWLALDDAAFDAALDAQWEAKRLVEPAFWRDARFNRPSQPVVGVSWYESRAFAAWLSAQSGIAFRLPTEVEWEAAARGIAGRTYPWGDRWHRLRANADETRLRATSPVGVFPDGATPEGVGDLAGNAYEWTSSLYGDGDKATDGDAVAAFGYPYDPADGREDPGAPRSVARVVRGGSWSSIPETARACFRVGRDPDGRFSDDGFRLAAPLEAGTARGGVVRKA